MAESPLRYTTVLAQPQPQTDFARDVRAGLGKAGQKELSCKHLYDELGTALFEAITLLPEYGLLRADERLLKQYADAILDHVQFPVAVAELGSGTGRKTRWLLEALARRQAVVYYPVDVSASALLKCRRELFEVAPVTVLGLEQTYLEGLRLVVGRREPELSLLVLFLGSTIGNFERAPAEAFLAEIRCCLKPGDALLVGADLEKPLEQMLAAYDDPTGVTAAFNLNLLARMNRELGANFELRQFRHEARYNQRERRIEMHLVSLDRQEVWIPGADLRVLLEEGETIWTESCHKFSLEELPEMARRMGYVSVAQWVDTDWAFAENLWMVPAS
jgi:dimethylhistidine N-methyltransferase